MELAIQQLRDGGFTSLQMDEFLETLHRMEADDSILAPLTNALLAMNVSVQWLM
jgi:chloramphenicol 3-O-phosphotransferase